MEEQEAVSPVENTTETESAPVETNTEPSQEAPTSETAGTEDKVSKSVPYDRFHEINEAKKAIKKKNAYLKSISQAPQEQYQPPIADPDTDQYVDYRAEQKAREIVEAQELARFDAKHAKEFEKDPLLKAAMAVDFNKAKASGQYYDLEAGLERAKQSLESRLKPIQEKAKQEGVQEGQDIAKTKQQLGAVGETGKQSEVDESKLSAAEWAKLHNIPRV